VSAGPYVAVVGSGEAGDSLLRLARAVGRGLAERGAVVICGGLGGVMEAVCEGVAEGGGTSIGLLPGAERAHANRWVTYAVPTGIGEARNAIVARAADVVIAVGGEFGTLSEIALALRYGTPVVGLDTWALGGRTGPADPIARAESAEEAVDLALELAAPDQSG
jgi:uncharacterized protein (TIGR00725 family)